MKQNPDIPDCRNCKASKPHIYPSPDSGKAAIRLMYDDYPRITFFPFVAYGRTAVCGAVINENDLYIMISLCNDRDDAFIQIFLDLEYWYNDGDQWLHHFFHRDLEA